ncbi:MAG TPA: nucleoside-diphosphate sugar epimerase/dehydratase [Bacteroidales bacterium]|nr:nucleoside-diphosphate sugar epimerase/dehydratase [Bacteroidales bacterium]
MKNNLISLRKTTPRWIVFTVDVLICLIALHAAYLIRFNFSIPQHELVPYLNWVLPMVVIIRALTYFIFKTYSGIVRYTGVEDSLRILKVVFWGSVIFVLIDIFTYALWSTFIIPFSIIIIEFLSTVFLMVFLRLLIKSYFFEMTGSNRMRSLVAIIGKDNFALSVKRSLDNDISVNYNVLAFFDTENSRKSLRLEGIKIYAFEDFEAVVKKLKISHLIIADEKLNKQTRRDISEQAIELGLKVLEVPPLKSWINGELNLNQLKQIKIEDLLEREVIQLDKKNISMQVSNKVVMVTGAAGSIGREIVLQLTSFNPSLIILFDQAESPMYDLTLELEEKYHFKNFKYIIGDITNRERLEYIIKRYQPLVIYHAAAYKHVPVMENNPAEAVFTNVKGTKLLADLAHQYNIERFVMISTDKAVNPTNVMGASKRIAEMYCQALGKTSKTKFITTRFGNVLGSNGSVIPRFKQQIENGGPITVTHPEITRYFMTIPEACQLVLEAGAMANGNEIYIFDMGKPVKIVDLARKMIRLAGLQEGKDIEIVFTGLRPGEKIYEELLNKKENTLPTYHPLIMIAKVVEIPYEHISSQVEELISTVPLFDNYELVKKMKQIVPEFKSMNSAFEKLDK